MDWKMGGKLAGLLSLKGCEELCRVHLTICSQLCLITPGEWDVRYSQQAYRWSKIVGDTLEGRIAIQYNLIRLKKNDLIEI